MHKSIEVLKLLPGHEERVETCESIRDTLLLQLRPSLRSDLLGHDMTPLFEYIYVYGKLNR